MLVERTCSDTGASQAQDHRTSLSSRRAEKFGFETRNRDDAFRPRLPRAQRRESANGAGKIPHQYVAGTRVERDYRAGLDPYRPSKLFVEEVAKVYGESIAELDSPAPGRIDARRSPYRGMGSLSIDGMSFKCCESFERSGDAACGARRVRVTMDQGAVSQHLQPPCVRVRTHRGGTRRARQDGRIDAQRGVPRLPAQWNLFELFVREEAPLKTRDDRRVRRLRVTADTLCKEVGPPIGTLDSIEARHSVCDMRSDSSELTGPLSITIPACSPSSTTKQRLDGNGCSGDAPRARITGHAANRNDQRTNGHHSDEHWFSARTDMEQYIKRSIRKRSFA